MRSAKRLCQWPIRWQQTKCFHARIFGLVLAITSGWVDTPLLSQENQNPVIIEAKKESPESQYNTQSGVKILDLSDQTYSSDSIAEILERQAAVRVNRYGGRGAYSSLSLRGSNPNQVNVFIDGIPITGAAGSEINLSDLNPDSYERIEIHKSGSWPGSAIGGSINLVTKKSAPQRSGGSIKAIAGSHQTYGMGADYNGGKQIHYMLAAKAETSEQKYKFINHNGTPLINPLDDFEDRRKNAWYRNYFGTLNLSASDANTDYFFLNDTALRHHGMPGPLPAQSDKTKRKIFRNTSGAGLDSKSLFVENFRLKSRVYYTDSRNSLYDPDKEFSLNQPNAKARTNQYGLHVEPWMYLLEYNQIWKLYLASEREQYKSDKRNQYDMLLSKDPTRFRNHLTTRLSNEISFYDERISFIPAVEYQRYVDRFNEPQNTQSNAYNQTKNKNTSELSNYKLSAVAILIKNTEYEVAIQAGGNTANRVASFLELFGERGSIIGNTSLKPEEATTGEAGFQIKSNHKNISGKLELTAFHKTIQNMILLVPNSRFTLRPENVDNADIRGVETGLQLQIFDMCKFYSNYTWQRAINTSNIKSIKGKYLPLRPLHESTTGLSFYGQDWESGLEAVYVGAVYRNRTNEATAYVNPRWSYNYFIKYSIYKELDKDNKIKEELGLGLEVKNLQNKLYTDITEYPLPGRTAYLTLNWKF